MKHEIKPTTQYGAIQAQYLSPLEEIPEGRFPILCTGPVKNPALYVVVIGAKDTLYVIRIKHGTLDFGEDPPEHFQLKIHRKSNTVEGSEMEFSLVESLVKKQKDIIENTKDRSTPEEIPFKNFDFDIKQTEPAAFQFQKNGNSVAISAREYYPVIAELPGIHQPVAVEREPVIRVIIGNEDGVFLLEIPRGLFDALFSDSLEVKGACDIIFPDNGSGFLYPMPIQRSEKKEK